MKKQIGTLAIGILMLASAMAMYGGESETFPTNLTNPVYTVIGNQSNLDGLNISYDNRNITISPALNFKPDNFTLIFFDNITHEVERIIHTSSGGGSRTRYVDKNVTVYVPEYVETVKEVEVEKVIESIEYVNGEDGFKTWHVLFAMLCGGCFIWFVMRKKK